MSADHIFVVHSAELQQVKPPSEDEAWEKLKSWTVQQLRTWLGLRGVRAGDAKKADLVRIAYFTWKLAVPVNADEITTQREAATRLENLLRRGNKVLSNPKDVSEWIGDLKQMPTVTYADIYNYLINTPGVTVERLKAYKSLESYNYAISGWVQELNIYQASDEITFVKAKVKPSQHTGPPHEAWVMVKECGTIEAGRCSCTAGLGQVCSHVGGVLFKMMGASELGLNLPDACTSIACKWNNAFCEEVIAQIVEKINFRKPRVNEDWKKSRPIRKWSCSSSGSSSSDGEFADILAEAAPNCAALHLYDHTPCEVFYDIDEVESDVSIEESDFLPMFPDSIEEIAENSPQENLFELIQTSVSPQQSLMIMESTKEQYLNNQWFQLRENRITASKMGEVYNFMISRRKAPSTTLMNKIIGPSKDLSHLPQIKWGHNHEDDARNEYIKMSLCDDLNVQKCGIKIPAGDAHIGATPDGHVTCNCCQDRLLEIKCPYAAAQKDLTPAEAVEIGLITYLDDHGHLIEGHEYYTQVQGQMALLEVFQCDFVVWTPKGIHIDHISFDEDYWDDVKECLDSFYVRYVLPKLTIERPTPATIDDLQPPPKKQRKERSVKM